MSMALLGGSLRIALKETVVAVEPISTKTARDAQETKYKERSELGGKLEENNFHYHGQKLKIAILILMIYDSGEAISSTKVQCSISSLILLLKNDMKELIIGWSVILPLSWIKAFWILLISNGAYAIVQWETPDLSTWEHLTNAISLPNPCHGNFEISNSNSGSNSLDGIVVRTDGKARMSKFINSELKLDQRHRKSDIYDHKLCFVRVHLHPFKEGCFEEGAVICMDFKDGGHGDDRGDGSGGGHDNNSHVGGATGGHGSMVVVKVTTMRVVVETVISGGGGDIHDNDRFQIF
ncbi:hypothetical protein JHK82_044475 [Glycine max]|nr:hypothetical protein JHK82_044475 [Glycine max]